MVLKFFGNVLHETKHELLKKRFLCVVILLFVLIATMASGTERLMLHIGFKISPWMAPHFFSDKKFVFVYGLILVFAFSGVPYMCKSELPKILRKNRYLWLTEKLMVIFVKSIVITVLAFVMSVVVYLPYVYFTNEWGKVINTLAYSSYSWKFNIIGVTNRNIIEKYTPYEAVINSFLLTVGVTFIVGLLMFAISLWINRAASVVVAVMIACAEYVRISETLEKVTSKIIPLNWMKLGNFSTYNLQTYIFGIDYHRRIIIVTIIVLIFLVLIRGKHLEFDFYKEEQ